ncbi:aspartate ammonia-lyase [Merdimmobilis hominis]|uniref:Aspartate ammonia-lyase n=1 Tax=uncultured Anaerotruncus sp. TaxID=905011 RepID=A0A6N2R959_9FIRM|nr:aspartate ammonia-lyase [uncultured Merdimmobilis sp.]
MAFRTESDSIGSKQIPAEAYYGVQSLRGAENFHITGAKLHPEFINSLAAIKKASALNNLAVGELDKSICDAICQACDEIMAGQFHDQFICDAIQGGAGTTANMNANEVIANRAIEILGGTKGDYSVVHPNDHVNRAQSTNDVIPTAGKITTIKLLQAAVKELQRLEKSLAAKEKEFDSVVKMGRTQMQDAVPIRLGQEFGAYRSVVARDLKRFSELMPYLYSINMGGTAIGTCLNANRGYVGHIAVTLGEITGLPLVKADDLVDATQHVDVFAQVSGVLRTCALSLSKMANDLRLMSSGPRTGFGEINLPAKQNGSSIMPGKVNPVIPEVMSQVAFNIIGNDVAITMAAEGGQLELNAFEPVIYYNLFESIMTLTNGVNTFIDNCIDGITANEKHCADLVHGSVGIITAICPKVGYQLAASIAKEAIKTGASVRELLERENIFSKEELDEILDVYAMTK